jgi:glycosyltransferase involved in cell wall biosynthesis
MGGGWVIPIRSEGALADRMKELCDDPALIRKEGVLGQKVWRENFTPKMMFERYLAFWRECGAQV